jgi:hypothetical protein
VLFTNLVNIGHLQCPNGLEQAPRRLRRRQRQHWPTPTKAKIQGTIEYLKAQKISHLKPDVFSHFSVSKRSGWAILANEHPRRRYNNLLQKETRGKLSKIIN